MSKLDLRIVGIDSGFCRIYFRDRQTNNLFCIQDESAWGNTCFVLYYCTEGQGFQEPCSEIKWSSIKAIDDPAKKYPGNKLAESISKWIGNLTLSA